MNAEYRKLKFLHINLSVISKKKEKKRIFYNETTLEQCSEKAYIRILKLLY